jgi:penicillin-binding protein 1B
MPLNIKALKIIFFAVSSFVIMSHNVALAEESKTTEPSREGFNPFTLSQEFQNKLNSKAILTTTKYFASGSSFTKGKSITTDELKKLFSKENYRERSPDQALTANDFLILTNPVQCASLVHVELKSEINCVLWKNADLQDFLILLENNTVAATYSGSPLTISLYAEMNPKLVAQYRNNEPLMQEEKKIADIPVQCLNAVIAIEDNDFLDHSGVSYTGLARAFIKNIIKMRKAQGGSTITQQLIKNYFLTSEKTISRKAKELYMATKLESEWTKDEILQTYLNIIYMGQIGAFQIRGFPAAGQAYFGKNIENLNLAQCALLAAIINNPGMNHPVKKKEKSQARRNLVLTKMKELKLITEKEFAEAEAYPMPAAIENKASETAPYFFDAVRSQARELGIETEGHSFYTSLDLEAQDSAQKSLQSGIQNLTEQKAKLKLKKEKGTELQGVIMTSENHTGFVTAFVGGQSYRQSQFNRALNSQRQIGSLVKPIVYLSGLLYGLKDDKDINPLTILNDQYFEWAYDKKKWSPENYDKKFRGEIPYYYALKESLNSPTAQVAQTVGLDQVIMTAQKLGLTTKIETTPATSLGASNHYPIEILQTYTTLANLGQYQKLSFIKKITNENNEILFQVSSPTKEQRTDLIQTAVLVGMMKETLKTGTAKSTQALGFKLPAAGKTGTTSNGNDAWFAGFTPQLTTVVWLGFDQNLATHLTGASGAVPIWTEHMKKMSLSYSSQNSSNDFTWPEGTELKEHEFNSKFTNEKTTLVFKK